MIGGHLPAIGAHSFPAITIIHRVKLWLAGRSYEFPEHVTDIDLIRYIYYDAILFFDMSPDTCSSLNRGMEH
jgi:hypothetical protein